MWTGLLWVIVILVILSFWLKQNATGCMKKKMWFLVSKTTRLLLILTQSALFQHRKKRYKNNTGPTLALTCLVFQIFWNQSSPWSFWTQSLDKKDVHVICTLITQVVQPISQVSNFTFVCQHLELVMFSVSFHYLTLLSWLNWIKIRKGINWSSYLFCIKAFSHDSVTPKTFSAKSFCMLSDFFTEICYLVVLHFKNFYDHIVC